MKNDDAYFLYAKQPLIYLERGNLNNISNVRILAFRA